MTRPVVRLDPKLAPRIEAERQRRSKLAGVEVSTAATVTALVEEALKRIERKAP